MFFEILAKPLAQRSPQFKDRDFIPYLNSSLFEIHPDEKRLIAIANLSDDASINYHSKTVVRDANKNRKSGEINTLTYLLDFLDAYDFGSDSSDELVKDNKDLINASVLGLIFEKINGYKDGSFYTPSFITMYMARETITKAVIDKFNTVKSWECKTLNELHNKIEDKVEANKIINTLTICDPAVGSGHFLVSSLNELIFIKNELDILIDENGKKLKCSITIENDELVIFDDEDEVFHYKPKSKDSSRIQKTPFNEKQTLIENCLFGVDINPNSTQITKLRLWIELLKNAYYKEDGTLETLPNIDINIKTGNSLISRFAIGDALKDKKIKAEIAVYKTAVQNYKNNVGNKHEVMRSIDAIKAKFSHNLIDVHWANKGLNNKLVEFVGLYGIDKSLSKDLTYKAIQAEIMYQTSLIDDARPSQNEQKHRKDLLQTIHDYETQIEKLKSGKIYENAFEWRYEFPEVLDENGDYIGFDVVIGNPPYGVKLSKFELEILKNNTPCWKATILQDSYFAFLVLGLALGKTVGGLSFIIPNTWRLISAAADFRKESLSQFGLYQVETFLKPIFDEAVVDCDIVFYAKRKNEIVILNVNDSEQRQKSQSIPTNIITAHGSINSQLSIEEYKIIDKTRANAAKLGEITEIKNGVKPYEVGKGSPKQTRITLEEKPYTSVYKKDETFVPLIGGSNFHKYVLRWNQDNFISYGEQLAAPRDPLIFKKRKKIIVRQTSDSIIATIIGRGYVMRNNTHIILKKNPAFQLEYILSLLNSRMFDFIYWTINPEKGEALAEVKAIHLESLPIRKIEKSAQKPYVKLVNKILAEKKLDPKADTSTLEAEIDVMVYRLYELSYDEVKTIDPDFSMTSDIYDSQEKETP